MEFRLTYEGRLLGASRNNTRAAHKHDIRRAFHSQLKYFWQVHPFLNRVKESYPNPPGGEDKLSVVLANRFARCGFRFVPLATRELSVRCSVRILFLRADLPGGVLQSGDIDNRLKTIFDALRIPRDASELAGATPEEGEDPFFCLLEDDSIISHAEVETDMLLAQQSPEPDTNDARLVITVELKPYNITWGNINYG